MRSFQYTRARAALAVALGVCALSASRAGAQNEQQPTGGFDLTQDADKRLYQQYAHRADIKVDGVEPIFKAERVSHVANGVALRNRTRGFIHSRGVPLLSEVVRSFLLWNLSDSEQKGADEMPVLFDGNLVVGRQTADNTDPCWGRAGNHSYIADVTPFTNQAGGSNQDFEVTLAFSADTSTSGQDPWTASETSKALLEGASPVVIFRNESTAGPLYLFAPPGDNMFLSSASYLLPSPGQGPGQFTMIGGDGQRGTTHSNFASNELTFFDGSDGLTLPQLWDTHTHEVSIANPVSQVDYTQNVDCLVVVGFVLDQE